jgi:hypothetical protein
MNPSPVGTGTSSPFYVGVYEDIGNAFRVLGGSSDTLEASTPTELDGGVLSLNISEKKFPAAHYMFTVTLVHEVPSGGSIEVYFP